MRIIGGTLKGRYISPKMKSWPTRPTTDISKEALFNILMNKISFEETKMLDLFGGAGNHTWEFLSRGCPDVTYVDNYRGCLSFAKAQRTEFGFESELKIVNQDVKRFIKNSSESYSYIFAGPPYPLPWLADIPDMIFRYGLLAPEGLFVMEHNPNHNFENHRNFIRFRKYGQTIFAFFRNVK